MADLITINPIYPGTGENNPTPSTTGGNLIVNGVKIPTNGDYVKYGSTKLSQVDVVSGGVTTTVWKKNTIPLGVFKASVSGGMTPVTQNSSALSCSGKTQSAENLDWVLSLDTGRFAIPDGKTSFVFKIQVTFTAASSLWYYYRIYYNSSQSPGIANYPNCERCELLEGTSSHTITGSGQDGFAGLHVWIHGSNVRGADQLNSLSKTDFYFT